MEFSRHVGCHEHAWGCRDGALGAGRAVRSGEPPSNAAGSLNDGGESRLPERFTGPVGETGAKHVPLEGVLAGRQHRL